MNTENLLLILVFIFAQNKQLMEDVRPVLDFLEEHKGAVSVLEQMLNRPHGPEAPEAAEPSEQNGENGEKTDRREKPQSPLQEIADEKILNAIRSYLDNQAK